MIEMVGYFCRWKEECNTVTQAFDRKVKDMKEELVRERKRTGELGRLLRVCTDKMTEAQRTLGEYSEHIQNMEERIRSNEVRQVASNRVVSR